MSFSGSLFRRWVKVGVVLLSIAVVAGALFIWSGVYNIAASSDHWSITTWIIERVRVRSVATWSSFVGDPPPLDDPDLIRLGAAHFEGGCTPCHSRPGEPINAIAASMLPPPPPLALTVADEDAKALFWIVKHGLKYTAMPAWSAQQRNDEVWAVTSFLVRLPQLTSLEYGELAGATGARGGQRSLDELAESSRPVALSQCVRCHGDASTPPRSGLVPRLDGQPHAYLARALDEYASGLRSSGIMQPVADVLEEDVRRRLAAYYAALDPLPVQASADPEDADPEDTERGRELASEGDPGRGVPPCFACHSADHPDVFPSLAGQNAAYLANQLRVFKRGARRGSAYADIMTVIARRLTEEQIVHAAAYFTSLTAADLDGAAEPAR